MTWTMDTAFGGWTRPRTEDGRGRIQRAEGARARTREIFEVFLDTGISKTTGPWTRGVRYTQACTERSGLFCIQCEQLRNVLRVFHFFRMNFLELSARSAWTLRGAARSVVRSRSQLDISQLFSDDFSKIFRILELPKLPF